GQRQIVGPGIEGVGGHPPRQRGELIDAGPLLGAEAVVVLAPLELAAAGAGCQAQRQDKDATPVDVLLRHGPLPSREFPPPAPGRAPVIGKSAGDLKSPAWPLSRRAARFPLSPSQPRIETGSHPPARPACDHSPTRGKSALPSGRPSAATERDRVAHRLRNVLATEEHSPNEKNS